MTTLDNSIIKGIDLEERENQYIREWGVKHKLDSSEHKEETNRTSFRRQRDRILYTGGFRRLQDKTQVIAATKTGDHRTRLTHSIEVEQIAISIADALGLNRDLVSAIAIGHDVGHTPFGHSVERFLDKKLKTKGGFSHAVQSVKYLKEKGIVLSNEVYQGILKHDTDVYAGSYDERQFDCCEYFPQEPGNLESQVVYWADKLAYISHDFEDFYKTKIYENAKEHDSNLEKSLRLILSKLIEDEEKSKKVAEDLKNFETRDLIRNLISKLIKESLNNILELKKENKLINQKRLIEETDRRIKRVENSMKIEMADDEQKKKIKKKAYPKGLIIGFNDTYYTNYLELRKILDDYYIKSPEVQRSDAKAVKIVESLYDQFIENPSILPLNIKKKIDDDDSNIERVVADYIASMTDRYAEEVYSNLNSIGSYYDY